MEADWDLHAVVRGCCSAVSPTTTPPPPPLDAYSHQYPSFYVQNCKGFIPDLCQQTSDNSHQNPSFYVQKLPFSPQTIPVSPLSVLGGIQDPPYHHRHQQDEKRFAGKQQSLGISRCTTAHEQGTTKFKRRKNQIKRVCQVPAEESSSDLWSWRKYGQKPIKGSPYPRGYYKCSTSKGCMARKQLERNRSDPGMLTITYTGEHTHPVPTHRSSLTATSRSKTISSTDDNKRINKPTPSSPVSLETSISPARVDF